jgi:predicted acetyltransferase
MKGIGLNQLKNFDMKYVAEMFKKFDKNFSTLATNQIYMQENQIEFEKYLKTILANQEKIMKVINNNVSNLTTEIETSEELPKGRIFEND